jgi:hypothetical protein
LPIGSEDMMPILHFMFHEGVKEFFDGKLASACEDIETIDNDEVSLIWKGNIRMFPFPLSSSPSTLLCEDLNDISLEEVTDYAMLVHFHFTNTTSSGILTALLHMTKEAERMGIWEDNVHILRWFENLLKFFLRLVIL